MYLVIVNQFDVNLFQSRYRAASHFRIAENLGLSQRSVVSISLSSGFSFQGGRRGLRWCCRSCFNLVIERLLISGIRAETENEK